MREIKTMADARWWIRTHMKNCVEYRCDQPHRLLAFIEDEVGARQIDPNLVLVRKNSGGVLPDGTTNTPAIDYLAAKDLSMAEHDDSRNKGR